MKESSTSKRLARNTFFMYARMFFLLAIALYTSRIVLEQLGVEDFGTYNLVGSVVAMFGSLRTLFASSTQRFLNYEMGKWEKVSDCKDKMINGMNRIFNMSVNVNVLMSILFVICVEIVGIWFFNNKINIDASRMNAAMIVFQFSIASVVLTIYTTPFDAEIIAHEKMDYYAIMAVIEGLLKLGIVFLLKFFSFDKLEFYGILLFVVHLFTFSVNYFYCHHRFDECRIRFLWDNDLFKRIFSFSGWNFLGNTAYSLAHNGINMVLNVFGGAAVNAARGIAYQVQSAVISLLTNISIVIKPYCIREYAKEEYDTFNNVLCISSKIMFSIQLCLVILLSFNIHWILKIWLEEVPLYASLFTQIILVDTLIRSLSPSIDIAFMSEGKMKNYQIVEGILLSLPLLAAYIVLRNEAPYYCTFVAICFFEIINLSVTLWLAGRETKLNVKMYVKNVIVPCSICFLLYICVGLGWASYFSPLNKFCLSLCLSIVLIITMWLAGFSRKERQIVLSVIKK